MSIINQPIKVKEIILIDDGSTDDSGDKLSLKYKWIKVIHQKNAGVSVARNKGIELSECDYITFCDADDMWVNNFLNEDVCDTLAKDYDVVGYQHYEADSKLLKKN